VEKVEEQFSQLPLADGAQEAATVPDARIAND
jgi:hypothetical protein